MLSRRLACVLAGLAGGFVVAARPAVVLAGFDAQDFFIVRQAVALDRAKGLAHFELQFNQKPDFFTTDEFHRPANSFQYFVSPDGGTPRLDPQQSLEHTRDIVRGDEIRTSGKVLLRDGAVAANPQPNSGGWGPVMASAPFDLVNGDTVTFTYTFGQLRSPNGRFAYEVDSYVYGATTSSIAARAVPLPGGAAAGIVTLAGAAGVGALRRLRRRKA